jgi:outer membrane protein assembly factor BamA
MPIMGSYSTLRGFASRRFTDASAMKVSVDYRYRIWRYVDFGLFTDAGQVGSEIGDFGWRRFHYGYGIRLIGQGKGRRAASIDVAFSDERIFAIYVNFAPAF